MMKKSVIDPYTFIYPLNNPAMPGALGADSTMISANEGSSIGPGGNPPIENAQKFAQEQERLLVTYNVKVEHLEIANHIVQILYLLPTDKNLLQ
jgi:hypothetical protein